MLTILQESSAVEKGPSETELSDLYPKFREYFTAFVEKRNDAVFLNLVELKDQILGMCLITVHIIFNKMLDITIPPDVFEAEPDENASSAEICLLYQKELKVVKVEELKAMPIVAFYKGRSVGFSNCLNLHHNMQYDQCM